MKLCNLGVTALVLISVKYGLGVHTKYAPQNDLEQALKVLWATTLLFFLGISLSKISVLTYYGKIFRARAHPNIVWRWTYYFIFAATIVSLIGFVLLAVFQCQPVQRFWDRTGEGNCYAYHTILFSNSICSAILDLLILLSPLPPIWKLNLGKNRKWVLTGVFILGYS